MFSVNKYIKYINDSIEKIHVYWIKVSQKVDRENKITADCLVLLMLAAWLL